MTPAQAAWVREHVWTPAMRATYATTPGFYTTCACQWGPSGWCANGSCRRCHAGEPSPGWAAIVCGPTGDKPRHFAEPFRHPTPSATGAHRERLALVWLADRVCRWVCPHACHDQLDLFAEVAR